jgi:hypothetical protein
MARKRSGGFITVRGLKDLQRALREIDKQLPREMGTASQKVAQHVVDTATLKARALGRLQARAARSLTAARQQRVAAVNFGGARYPMALGAEFGAIQNVPRSVIRHGRQTTALGLNQFHPWRGNSTDAGYFLYPTIRREGDRIVELFGEALDDLVARLF